MQSNDALTEIDEDFGSPGIEMARETVTARRRLAPLLPRAQSSGLIRGTAHSAMRWPVRIWAILDAVIAAGSFTAGHLLSPKYKPEIGLSYNLPLAACIFGLALVTSNYILGMYDRHNFASRSRIVSFTAVASALALAATSLAYGWLDYSNIGRYVLLIVFCLSTGLLATMRMAAREIAQQARIRVLFVGDRSRFCRLESEIAASYGAFYEPPRFVGADSVSSETSRRILTEFKSFLPDEVVVDDNDGAILTVLQQASAMISRGCAIYSYSQYFEELLRQIPIETIDHRGVLGGGLRVSGAAALAKRPLDVLLAAAGLVLGAPLMLLVAGLVMLTSPGPVIYSQVRTGRYGRPFRIYKFRTMRQDAEENGPVWAQAGDCRVTPVGGLLRKSRLDELPQLWNVLLGEMSFVGPRPERPEFVQELSRKIPHYDLRHLVPPGLTGWAQVSYRYGASIDDAGRKLAYDLYYIRHYGPMFDLAVCLRTVAAMAKGAR